MGLINSIGKVWQGLKEEGVGGAIKAIGKGLSENWIATTVLCLIPGVGQVLGPLALAATAADCMGACDLKSDKAKAAAESEAPPNAQYA